MSLRLTKKGDTIIEVLLAMTLLTTVLFTSWGLANRTTQISLAARKRVVMVNHLKEQAEVLKELYAQEKGSGAELKKKIQEPPLSVPASTTNYGSQFCTDDPTITEDSDKFHINSSGKFESGLRTPVQDDPTSVVWIEYTNDEPTRYTDYYVRGCWLSGGSGQQTDSSQFIVRLNK